MKKNLWFVFSLLLFFPFSFAQEPVLAGSMVLVRCDNGKNEFLASPSDIDLSVLQQSFSSQVDTIVMVHGFNTKPDGAKTTFEGTTALLKSHLGVRNYVGFYWPADMLIDFGKAVSNANESGRYLVHVLSTVSKWYGSSGRSIHLMTHSLGGRVLLSTLLQNEARYVKWGNCFNMAPAVHSDIYFASFSGTNLLPKKTWAYYSGADPVLKYLYALYYWLFERGELGNIPGYDQWDTLSFPEKVDYLRRLDLYVQDGNVPSSELDVLLYAAIERGEKAMGLIGAKLGDPVVITKVENVEVTSIVSGHTYWSNATVMTMIGQTLK